MSSFAASLSLSISLPPHPPHAHTCICIYFLWMCVYLRLHLSVCFTKYIFMFIYISVFFDMSACLLCKIYTDLHWIATGSWSPELFQNLSCFSEMESLAQLEALCERLYNSQDSAERAHAENALKCFSTNTDYISQCQYILDNSLTPYALMLASSSLLKQVTEHSLSLQLRLDISNIYTAWVSS